jgi:hypothetical protein
LVLLILFNDPLYALEILKPQLKVFVFSGLWISLFYATLLKYWIHAPESTYKGLKGGSQSNQREENPNKLNSTSMIIFLKETYFFLMGILIFAIYCFYSFKVTQHPTFSNQSQWPPAMMFSIVALGFFFAIYFVWYLFMTFFVLVKCCSIPMRQRVTILVNLFMLCVAVATVYEGTWTSTYKKGPAFVFFHFLFNLYVFVIFYLHFPVPDGSE